MKRAFIVLLSSAQILLSGLSAASTQLIYRNTFDTPDTLNDWVMEGPGIAEIDHGRLLIHSKWQSDLVSIQDQIPLTEPGGEKFYSFIEQWVKDREPDTLPHYLQPISTAKSKAGKFAGGHIQFWNKHAHPENFIIRLKFQAASPYPLHMVTFCGRGLNGEDVLDPKLNPRFGLATQYMHGDIHNYRISYWSGSRGTTNMRRAPGRKLTSEDANDIRAIALDREVQLELIRWKGRVVFKADGEKLVDWTDDEPFADGFFALRLMAAAKGWYDDYEVWELTENPFSPNKKE